ncbi:hypothetical protein [Paenibacillus campinasensis]|uniref:Uncharacterized protein n=1 Tax=Paenibacillus campinasensis TaxID=66347 RepID=A0A268ETB5_9BACL|nr:hypothetical protein [Paenibacillus campinasensis]PAD76373.1 hypothetical protein CHH67_12140 [Paenibacillus campinasensis]
MVEKAQERKPMFVPSHPNFRDMLRTVKTRKGLAILLHPSEPGYVCRDGHLYKDGIQLDVDAVRKLVNLNREIRDPLMMYGIFSFFYFKGDIRNRNYIECRKSDLYQFLELNKGGKGYPLLETLKSYESVMGWVSEKGVFPLLKIEQLPDGRLRLTSEYFHHVLNALLEECNLSSEYGYKYRLTSIPLAILSQRSRQAALVALEFAYLLETMSDGKGQREISIRALMNRVPSFGKVLRDESKSISYRNRHMRNILKRAETILKKVSDLKRRYPKMEIYIPKKLSVRDGQSLVILWRSPPAKKEGESK